jgi:Glucose-6-phosphate dehydrogenase, NAD binding domain
MSDADADAFVFFGATGDLAYEQIFPALQALTQSGHLNMPVVGVAKPDWTVEHLRDRARDSITTCSSRNDASRRTRCRRRLLLPHHSCRPQGARQAACRIWRTGWTHRVSFPDGSVTRVDGELPIVPPKTPAPPVHGEFQNAEEISDSPCTTHALAASQLRAAQGRCTPSHPTIMSIGGSHPAAGPLPDVIGDHRRRR